MSRHLLILVLLVCGTGCSATRPRWNTIVVTPPGLSLRQLPCEDSRRWSAVAVTYPSESLIPAPCAPSPVRSVELVTYLAEDHSHAPLSPSGSLPAVTTVVPVPPVPVPAPAPPAIVHLEDATRPQLAHLPVSNHEPVPWGGTSMIQTAVAVTSPSGTLSPPACGPSPVRPVQLVTCVEEDERPAPRSFSGSVPAVTTVIPDPPVPVPASAPPTIVHLDNATSPVSMSTLPAPPVRVESPPTIASNWKPTTSTALVSPVQTTSTIRSDQDATTPPQVRHVIPVEFPSPPVLVQADLSELLTEIRNQRQLIEALQRDLTRERSADDAAIEELEAAVDNLLVQTTQHELPTTLRK